MKRNFLQEVAAVAVTAVAMNMGADARAQQLIPMEFDSYITKDYAKQWDQPYNAYSDRVLTRIDLLLGTDKDNATLQTDIVYSYDSRGKTMGINEPMVLSVDSTGKARLMKIQYEETDTSLYYRIDEQDENGEWYLYDLEESRYWNGFTTEYKEQYWSYAQQKILVLYATTSDYDALGRPTVSISRHYDDPYFRTEYGYESEDDVEPMVTTWNWNAGNQEWVPDFRTRTRNHDGMHGYESYTWDTVAQAWTGEDKYDRQYREDGKKVLDISYSWSAQSEKWTPSTRQTYVYDDEGNCTGQFTDRWNAAEYNWTASEEKHSEYQENGVKCSQWSITYVEGGAALGNRTDFPSDLEGRTLSNASYMLVSANPPVWRGTKRTDYEYSQYDVEGNNPSVTTFKWDTKEDCWVNSTRTIVELDDHGSCTYTTSQKWNGSEWVGSSFCSYEFIYDSQGTAFMTRSQEISVFEDGFSGHMDSIEYDSSFELERERVYDMDNAGNWNLTDWRDTRRTYNAMGQEDSVMLMHNGMPEKLTTYEMTLSPYGLTSRQFNWNQSDSDWQIDRINIMTIADSAVFEIWKYDVELGMLVGDTHVEVYAKGDRYYKDMYVWDSLTWMPQSRVIVTLDANGDTIAYEEYRGMQDGMWIGYDKYEQQYDRWGHEILYAAYNWDSSHMDFKGASRWVTFYDEEGSKLGYEVYLWDNGRWDWIGLEKKLTTQVTGDGSDRKIEELYDWDRNTWSWWPDTYRDCLLETDEYGNLASLELTYKGWSAGIAEPSAMSYEHAIFRYADVTAVEPVPAAAADFVSIQDGTVSVTAPDGGPIRIIRTDGTIVVRATGSVSTALPAGLYIISASGRTVRVLLHE